MNICILKEHKLNEFRSPLVPEDIKRLKKKYPGYNFYIEPSKNRIFSDSLFYQSGCEKYISQKIDLYLSIKEVSAKQIKKNQNFMMFSHTIKGQEYNMPLLRKILKNDCSLIDYELLKDKKNKRLIGFGYFAGIMGAFLTIKNHLKINSPKKNSYKIDELLEILSKKNLNNLRILITGEGAVSNGAQFFLKKIGIKDKKTFKKNKYSSYFKVLSPSEYYKRLDKKFNLNDLMSGIGTYQSIFPNYFKEYNIFLSCHYWDQRFPKLFELNQVNKDFFQTIGDITCDINGSVPTTSRSTTLTKPYYKFKKTNIMAVDNLPSALPKESSEHFSKILTSLLPSILNSLNKESIEEFYISKKGYLNYRYINLLQNLI